MSSNISDIKKEAEIMFPALDDADELNLKLQSAFVAGATSNVSRIFWATDMKNFALLWLKKMYDKK